MHLVQTAGELMHPVLCVCCLSNHSVQLLKQTAGKLVNAVQAAGELVHSVQIADELVYPVQCVCCLPGHSVQLLKQQQAGIELKSIKSIKNLVNN